MSTSGKTHSDDNLAREAKAEEQEQEQTSSEKIKVEASPDVEPPKKKGRSMRAVLNVVVAQIDMGLLTAGAFVTTPAQISSLGDAGYGGWLLMVSFISYMRLLDLGTSGGTVKYSAGAIERGDKEDLARVVNSTAALFLGAGIVALIGTLVLSRALPAIYPNVLGPHGDSILLVGLSMVVDLSSRTFSASLRARSLHFIYDAFETVTVGFFKIFLVWWFAYHGGLSYRLLAILTLIETSCRMGFVTIVALIISPHMRRVNPFKANKEMTKKLTRMGIALSIISVSDIIRFQLDSAVIGYWVPDPSAISIFGIGTRLTSIAYGSIGVIGGILMPSFSGMTETGDKEGVRSLLRGSSLATDVVASVTLVNIAVLGPTFLELWLHKPWIPVSGQIMRLMLPSYFIALMAEPACGVIIGSGKLRGLTIFTLTEAFLNFVCSVVLVQFIGIYGVALGTAIPMFFMRGIVFPRLLRSTNGIGLGEYYKIHARPMLLTLVYGVAIGGMAFIDIKSFSLFFALCGVSLVVFLVLAPIFVPEFRGVIQKFGRKIFGRFMRKPQAT